MKHTYLTPHDIPSAVQGRKPWSGIPPENKKYIAQEKKYSKGDSPEQIGDYLWCWLPDCINCVGKKKDRLRRTRRHQAKRKITHP